MHHKKKKAKHRKHRRVGAFSLGKKDTGLTLAALAGGFLLGDTINTQIDSLVAKMMPASTTTTATANPSTGQTMVMVGEIGLGGLLLLKKHGAGTMGTVLKVSGGLLAGAGLKRALKSMGIIKGYQSVPVIGRHRMAGYQSVPVIGATPAQLAGRPAQLQGYKVNGYTPHGSGVMGSIGALDGGSGITTTANGSGYMG